MNNAGKLAKLEQLLARVKERSGARWTLPDPLAATWADEPPPTPRYPHPVTDADADAPDAPPVVEVAPDSVEVELGGMSSELSDFHPLPEALPDALAQAEASELAPRVEEIAAEVTSPESSQRLIAALSIPEAQVTLPVLPDVFDPSDFVRDDKAPSALSFGDVLARSLSIATKP